MDLTKAQSSILLIVVLLVALGLRLYKLDAHGIWYDEVITLRAASGIGDLDFVKENCCPIDSLPGAELQKDYADVGKHPFIAADFRKNNTLHNVINATIIDNSNALSYNIALHYWTQLFGFSDLACRMLSVLASLLIVFFAWYFGRIFFGAEKYALLLAFLFAISPALILSSNWIRSYSFTAFFCFLSTVLFLQIILFNKGRYYYLLYAIASLLTVFGHHMVLFVFVVHGIIALIFLRDSYSWKAFSVIAVIIAGSFGLWMFKFGAGGFKVLHLKGVHEAAKFAAHPEYLTHTWEFATPKNLALLSMGYLEVIFGADHLSWLNPYSIFLLIIPVSLIAIVYLFAADAFTKKLMTALILLIIASPLFASVCSFNAGQVHFFFGAYYSVFGAIFGPILLVLCVSKIHLLGRQKIVAITLAICQLVVILVAIPEAYKKASVYNKVKNPYAQLAEKIKQVYQPGDIVTYPNWYFAQRINWYLIDRNDIVQDIHAPTQKTVFIVRGTQPIQLMDLSELKGYQ